MWIKLALNVFYTIAIFISLYFVYMGFTNQRYEFCLAGAFSAGIFIILKLKLIKQVREGSKKK